MNLLSKFKRLFINDKPLPKTVNVPDICTVIIHPGQHCYEVDMTTAEISETEVKRLTGNKYMFQVKPNKMYEIGINKLTAARKLTARLKVINQNSGTLKQ